MTEIIETNGYICMKVYATDDNAYYAEAWNFTHHIFGYGDDMRDWENAGDIWGEVKEMYYIGNGKYSIAIDEKQFTAKELEEIMRSEKDLLVISNHPPDRWSEEQKVGWDTIDYIPFPNVPPTSSWEDVSTLSIPILNKMQEWKTKHREGKISIQGEATLVSIVLDVMKNVDRYCFVFPTTERVVEEKDGKKTSTFKFVRWR